MNYYYSLKNVKAKLYHGDSPKDIFLETLEFLAINNEFEQVSKIEIRFTTDEKFEDIVLFYKILFNEPVFVNKNNNYYALTYAKKLIDINERNTIFSKSNAFESNLIKLSDLYFRLYTLEKNDLGKSVITTDKRFKW